MKVHLAITIALVLPALIIPLPVMHIVLLIGFLGLLIITELINTAIETVVDLVTSQVNPSAKLAKDLGSSAVLLAAGLVVLFSMFIYWPYVYNLVRRSDWTVIISS